MKLQRVLRSFFLGLNINFCKILSSIYEFTKTLLGCFSFNFVRRKGLLVKYIRVCGEDFWNIALERKQEGDKK